MFHVIALMAETIEYNTAYADYVRRRGDLYARGNQAHGINELDLLNAHDWASSKGSDHNVPPPDGYTKVRFDSEYDCPRCMDTGKTVFTWVENGVCFDCGGRSRSKAKRSEAERTDARGVLDPA